MVESEVVVEVVGSGGGKSGGARGYGYISNVAEECSLPCLL